MICFPLFEGEQITQILLGLFLDIYFREYFSRRGWDVFSIPRGVNFTLENRPLNKTQPEYYAV